VRLPSHPPRPLLPDGIHTLERKRGTHYSLLLLLLFSVTPWLRGAKVLLSLIVDIPSHLPNNVFQADHGP
jgi:hypothetical protein